MSIPLPPLREHKEDIKELTEYFFQLYNRQLGTKVSHIDPFVFEKLVSYSWPGNVRELMNKINMKQAAEIIHARSFSDKISIWLNTPNPKGYFLIGLILFLIGFFIARFL